MLCNPSPCRVELGACESRYVAVKRISQALNNELLELYSLLDPPAQTAARWVDTHVTHTNMFTHTRTHTYEHTRTRSHAYTHAYVRTRDGHE